jgi:hypothetical protein
MESESEKRFYDALGTVPEVPAAVLDGIERRVRVSGVKRRIALAACLLLALIIPALVITQQMNASTAYAEEYDPMNELLYAFEFLSGGLDTDFLFDGVDADWDDDSRLAPIPEDTVQKALAKEGALQ